MNSNIKKVSISYFKNVATVTLLAIGIFIIPTTFTSCEIDDAMPGGGSIGGTVTNSKKFVGTWSKQVQWANTNGTREDTYTLKSGGKGTHKGWDWLDQKYVTQSVTWTAYGDYIEISNRDFTTHGYINSSGSALNIGDWWYNKQ